MMRAVVIAIDSSAAGCEPRVERRVDQLEKWFVDDAAADPTLVGHDDGRVTGTIQQANRIGREGIQLEQIQAIKITALFDDRAVAIEKDSRTHQATARATRSIAART